MRISTSYFTVLFVSVAFRWCCLATVFGGVPIFDENGRQTIQRHISTIYIHRNIIRLALIHLLFHYKRYCDSYSLHTIIRPKIRVCFLFQFLRPLLFFSFLSHFSLISFSVNKQTEENPILKKKKLTACATFPPPALIKPPGFSPLNC